MGGRDYLKYLGFKSAIAAAKVNTAITPWEYKQLEYLLAKLHDEVGHSFCIIPHYLHDGYHIGLYDSAGDNITAATGATIQETVEKLNLQSTTNDTTTGSD